MTKVLVHVKDNLDRFPELRQVPERQNKMKNRNTLKAGSLNHVPISSDPQVPTHPAQRQPTMKPYQSYS